MNCYAKLYVKVKLDMLKVDIVAIGSIKEDYFIDAINEYAKRLSRFCNLNIIELKEESNEKSVAKKIEKESDRLLEACKGFVVLLDRQGEMVTSEKLASLIDTASTKSGGNIIFIVGGSNGVSQKVRNRADLVVSFGNITYPHQLFRVVLIEQIYRAFTILNKLPYHK